MEKSVSEALEQKGWMARWYLIPERMVVRWEGLRLGKDTPCRVPPLLESTTWFLFTFQNSKIQSRKKDTKIFSFYLLFFLKFDKIQISFRGMEISFKYIGNKGGT